MRWWVWLWCWVGCLAFAQPGLEQNLQSAEQSLQSALRAPRAQRASHLQQALQSLQALPPDARTPLEEALQQAQNTLENEDVEAALESVRAYQAVAKPSASAPNPQQVQSQLERIYAEPGMQIPPKNLFERLTEAFQRAFEWLGRILQRLFGRIPVGGGWGAATQVFVIGMLVIAIAFFASYLLGKVQTRRPAPDGTRQVEELFRDARVMSASEWRALASRLALEGHYRQAVRALYLGLLRLLHEHRLLDYDPALTNWEHLERLRLPPLPVGIAGASDVPMELRQYAYQMMRAPTLRFDQLWYGHQPATPDDLQQLDALFGELRRRLSQSG